jgi:hypothetical protein
MAPFTQGRGLLQIFTTFNEVFVGGGLTALDLLGRFAGSSYESLVVGLDPIQKYIGWQIHGSLECGDTSFYRDMMSLPLSLPPAFGGSGGSVATGSSVRAQALAAARKGNTTARSALAPVPGEALAKTLESLPQLTPGSGGTMLLEALDVLRGLPGRLRADAFGKLSEQISAQVKGIWIAERYDVGNAVVYRGHLGEMLIFDATGNMYRGNSIGAAGAFRRTGWPWNRQTVVDFDAVSASGYRLLDPLH